MQVTNGNVVFSRTRKMGEFEPKKVEVMLSFTLGDGEDAESAVAQVGLLAQQRAMVMLGLPEHAPAQEPVQAAATAGLREQKPASTRKPKPPIVIGEPKVEAVAEPAADPTSLPADATQAADLASLDGAATTGAASPAASTGSASDLTSLDTGEVVTEDWSAAPADAKPISDKDLSDAVVRRNYELKNATIIRQLIGKYVVFPKGLREIEHDKRPAFIADLSKLAA